MPYSIEPRKSGYVVVNKITGKEYENKPITKEKAEGQKRILESVMNVDQYTEDLTKSQKDKQLKLIAKSKEEYKSGKVKDRPKVSDTPTKRSKYAVKFEKKYGFPITDSQVKKMFSDTDVETILSKGRAAYASGSRPNVSSNQWAYARLASVLTGGKALNI
jgi:hypothetical protein